MCEQIQGSSQQCDQGDNCIRCHTRVESFYHPEKYKAKFCSFYPNRLDLCEYGDICAFAHSEQELSISQLDKMTVDQDFYMFYYKTVWCPYSDREHQRDACVYAHNWQDF